MLLGIDLQDGFANDTVIILVNDKEVFRKRGVTTKLILGVSDSFELDIPETSAKIKIEITSRNLSETISLELAVPTYIGLSVVGGQITHIIYQKPFAYF